MTKPACSLSWLASRSGPVSDEEIEQIRYWISADWESHDIDRDAVKLIGRLVESLYEARAVEREKDARLDDADKRSAEKFYARITGQRVRAPKTRNRSCRR